VPGLAGRRRKPSHLRLLDGNRGKRAAPKNEPKPKRGKPQKPSHLSDDAIAAAEWDRLAKLTTSAGCDVLTIADGPMLEATVLAYSAFRRATLELKKGFTYEVRTKAGGTMHRARPQAAIASDAWRRYVSGLTHFGLSPAARGKVQTSGEEDATAIDEFD
jgi:P27 family predicted phage terminase small subunit